MDCSLFVLDPLLERGGNILGVVNESVPVAFLRLQDRVHQQSQLHQTTLSGLNDVIRNE